MALDDSLHIPDLDVVRETAPLYRLSAADADAAIAEVSHVVASWQAQARGLDLPGEEIERIGMAFTSS